MNGRKMMNHLCKTIALVLVLACCLACPWLQDPGTAFGADTGTVRIEGSESPWRAYRLIAGDVIDGRIAECSTEGLMNEEFWADSGIEGSGQDAAESLAALAGDDSQGAVTARLGRAAVASGAASLEVGAEEAGAGFPLESGYWLLVSETTQPMLLLVGSEGLTATVKSTGPALSKQVKDASGQWRDAGEAGQGQAVSYRIVSTLPSNASAYETLPYKVVDELPAGMRVDAGSVRVLVRDAEGAEKDVTSSCAISLSGCELTVDVGTGNALSVLPDRPGEASVVVLYEAKLTGKSAAGAKTGNPNLAHVEYVGSPTSETLTSTKEARAQLYTWKIRLVKTGSGKPLAKAVFELRDSEGGTVGKVRTDSDGRAEFPSAASGSYVLVETKAPEGYRTAADTKLTLSADIAARAEEVRLSARAKGAGTLKSVNVPKGTVTVTVEDVSDGLERVSEGLDEESEGISGSPKTGDAGGWPFAALGLLMAASAAFLACAVARRRGRWE